jgi:hypothetical protein
MPEIPVYTVVYRSIGIRSDASECGLQVPKPAASVDSQCFKQAWIPRYIILAEWMLKFVSQPQQKMRDVEDPIPLTGRSIDSKFSV